MIIVSHVQNIYVGIYVKLEFYQAEISEKRKKEIKKVY